MNQYANGLLLTDDGQVVIYDATAGLPEGATYCNGIPLTADGAVCIAQTPASNYSNGLPFAANGAISAAIV